MCSTIRRWRKPIRRRRLMGLIDWDKKAVLF
jgi:hypothetical protein